MSAFPAASSACAAGSRPIRSADGKQIWRAYSAGPDSDLLVDPQKTTVLGKPIGADFSLKTWQGDQWKIGGGTTWGWYWYDPAAQPDLLRHRQSLDLEPEAAARRQQVVDDDLRPRCRYRHGEMGLPDDAARPVGLRRRQRDDPGRPADRRPDSADAGSLRPQRPRLHAEPRDRRTAGRGQIRSGGELDDRRRHEQEQPDLRAAQRRRANTPRDATART